MTTGRPSRPSTSTTLYAQPYTHVRSVLLELTLPTRLPQHVTSPHTATFTYAMADNWDENLSSEDRPRLTIHWDGEQYTLSVACESERGG